MSAIALPLAILTSLLVYIICLLVVPKKILATTDPRLKKSLTRLEDEQKMRESGIDAEQQVRVKSDYIANPLTRAFLFMPGAERALPMIRKAGLASKLDTIVMAGFGLFLVLCLVFSGFGFLAIPIAFLSTLILMNLYLKRAIKKMHNKFIDLFPDALDMIVRSVRSGYPLHAALGMVADNMGPPVSTQFRRIVDEISYGWTMTEALNRFADRVKAPDIRFFVVVLAVQQESGGNLSEVLSNLSRVLRSRKQLRLKIRALSSEGRATAWFLGLLPVAILGALQIMAPEHLQPLYTTPTGLTYIVGAGIFMILAMFSVKQIINIDI